MLNWLVFAVVGEVLIFVWQKFQLPFKSKWFEKLHNCSLCSGAWIYSILAISFNVDIFADLFTPSFVGEVSTGILTSYLVWVFIAGWKAQHEVIVI